MKVLQIENLVAGYGRIRVLHGVSISVEEGSVAVLLGANGAGKTTTLRALCAMVQTSGEIRFGGARIDGRATEDIVRLGIGLYGLSENPALNEMLALEPVLEMKTIVSGVKKLKAGETVGYGNTFRADKDMTIATVPVDT